MFFDCIGILDYILDYIIDRLYRNSKRSWNQVSFALFSAAFQLLVWSRCSEWWWLLPASELTLSWYSFPSLEDSFQSSNPEYSSRLALKVVREWKNLLSQLPVNPTQMNSIPELGRPRVLYAVLLVLGGQSIKFRFRKPRVLLALFEMVLIWSFHRRSTDR